MPFFFFLLLNAVLYIRPGELVESLEPLRLYQLAMLGCLATTYAGLMSQFTGASLIARPMTVCMLWFLVAIVLSRLQFGDTWYARFLGTEFGKIVIYYALLMHNLDTPERFQRFLTALVLFSLFAISLILLQFHGMIDVAALQALSRREVDPRTGEMIEFPQLQGTGIFRDPNDISLVIGIVIMVCLYRLLKPQGGPNRFFWLVPMVVFLMAFLETKSRGGFLSLMVAINVLAVSRLGVKKLIPFWLLAAPVVLVLFGGRMTQIDVSEGTGQHRIQLWRDGLGLMRQYPLFGCGHQMMPEHFGLGAHNSYVQVFTELGFFGGTCFVALVFLAIVQLWRMRKYEHVIEDAEFRRLRPYLLGIVCGYCAGQLSLSRQNIVPTYTVLGMAAAYLAQAKFPADTPSPLWKTDSSLITRLIGVSLLVLAGLEIVSRILVRYDH